MRHHLRLFAIFSIAFSTGLAWSETTLDATKPANHGGNANPSLASSQASWQACRSIASEHERLACFDAWALSQTSPGTPDNPAPGIAADCRNGNTSVLSKFWELEEASDCGRFNIRGYRPISLSVVASDAVNTSPSSDAAGHSASSSTPYQTQEMRIQLSVRTKVGQGLVQTAQARDSLWFAYSQQSYWQVFTPDLSRPFRTTDHEPELIYILPTDAMLPLGWRLRYSGLSLNHQSNGQSLPLSRSWNRVIAMAGMEKNNWVVSGKFWQRVPESAENDDNPGIENWVGRAELNAGWLVNAENTLGLTVRSALAGTTRGSYKLDWFKALGSSARTPELGNQRSGGLRLHVQLFSGYGDTLIDYNRARTVLSVGLSLVDW
jgi:phospholipase A1